MIVFLFIVRICDVGHIRRHGKKRRKQYLPGHTDLLRMLGLLIRVTEMHFEDGTSMTVVDEWDTHGTSHTMGAAWRGKTMFTTPDFYRGDPGATATQLGTSRGCDAYGMTHGMAHHGHSCEHASQWESLGTRSLISSGSFGPRVTRAPLEGSERHGRSHVVNLGLPPGLEAPRLESQTAYSESSDQDHGNGRGRDALCQEASGSQSTNDGAAGVSPPTESSEGGLKSQQCVYQMSALQVSYQLLSQEQCSDSSSDGAGSYRSRRSASSFDASSFASEAQASSGSDSDGGEVHCKLCRTTVHSCCPGARGGGGRDDVASCLLQEALDSPGADGIDYTAECRPRDHASCDAGGCEEDRRSGGDSFATAGGCEGDRRSGGDSFATAVGAHHRQHVSQLGPSAHDSAVSSGHRTGAAGDTWTDIGAASFDAHRSFAANTATVASSEARNDPAHSRRNHANRSSAKLLSITQCDAELREANFAYV